MVNIPDLLKSDHLPHHVISSSATKIAGKLRYFVTRLRLLLKRFWGVWTCHFIFKVCSRGSNPLGELTSPIVPTAPAKQEQDKDHNQNRFKAHFLNPPLEKAIRAATWGTIIQMLTSSVLCSLSQFSSALRMPTLTGNFRARFDCFAMWAAILTIFRRHTTATGVSTAVFVLFVHK